MHLEKRKVRGRTYYCVVEKKRINGKVKTIKQIYLGSAERVAQLIEQPLPKFFSYSYGEMALLLHVAELSNFVNITNKHLMKEASIGDYLMLPILNRLLKPKSKQGIKAWYQKTCLPVIWNKEVHLSSQNYWYYLDRIKDEKIEVIWKELLLNVKEKLNVEDSAFLFDPTNFFTYIDDHEGNELLRNGHNKQKRNDKKQVCLGLMIGEQSLLPYWYDVYAGNTNDVKHFEKISSDITNKLSVYTKENVTLVFDKGNNSEKNFNAIKNYNFVGALTKEKTEAKDLLSEELKFCYKNSKGSEIKSVSKEAEVYGIKCKVVVSYNEELKKKQLHSLEERIANTHGKFKDIETHNFNSEKAAITAILKILPRKQNSFDYEIKKENSKFRLALNLNEEKVQWYKLIAGKNVIFTNHLDWSDERAIRAYRSMHKIENQFKILHGALLIPIKPVYHWTNQKIKAHIFLCMVSLLFARILEHICKEKAEGNFRQILDFAGTIRLALVQREDKPKLVFEEMDASQQALMEAFSLSRFAKD